MNNRTLVIYLLQSRAHVVTKRRCCCCLLCGGAFGCRCSLYVLVLVVSSDCSLYVLVLVVSSDDGDVTLDGPRIAPYPNEKFDRSKFHPTSKVQGYKLPGSSNWQLVHLHSSKYLVQQVEVGSIRNIPAYALLIESDVITWRPGIQNNCYLLSSCLGYRSLLKPKLVHLNRPNDIDVCYSNTLFRDRIKPKSEEYRYHY